MNEPHYKGQQIFVWPPALELKMITEKDSGAISDGFHTFKELYDHRCLLFLGMIKIQIALNDELGGLYIPPWKSRLHSDGTGLDGWFIAGLTLPGGPITYHLPNEMWDLCHAEEVERAPEWDGHTSADVVERLRSWLK